MKVLVDTSVWVDFLNGHDSAEKRLLAELIAGDGDVCTCGVVVAEVFQGLRGGRRRRELESLFRELTLVDRPGIDPYLEAAALYRELRTRGRTIRSTIDCLIAVLARSAGCAVLSRDRDLAAILDSGLLEVPALTAGG